VCHHHQETHSERAHTTKNGVEMMKLYVYTSFDFEGPKIVVYRVKGFLGTKKEACMSLQAK